MKKNIFYFMLKAYFVLEIFTFLLTFWLCRTRHDKKVKVNFKIHDVKDWTTNNLNTRIAKYLK